MDFDKNDLGDDNANLMPIRVPNSTVDINPVPIKLGTDDIDQAINNLPAKDRINPASPDPSMDSDGKSDDTKTQVKPSANPDKKDDVPMSPAKGN